MAKKSKKETKEETSTVEKKSIKKEKTKEEIEIEKITREKEKAINNKCPSCGAPIGFNPAVGKWKCEYCLSEF